jgi:hypothetical protein
MEPAAIVLVRDVCVTFLQAFSALSCPSMLTSAYAFDPIDTGL